jgi:hypothetical protein
MPLQAVHVGVPAWKGSAPYLAETLDSILMQTGADLRILISVDGRDEGVIALCGRFLADPRVTMVVQPARLGWVANCNIVLRAGWKSGADFYCIHPADDLMEPGYLAALLALAASNQGAAVVYSDIAAFGLLTTEIAQSSVIGTALQRQLILILRHFNAVAFRGLIRRSLFPRGPPLLRTKAHAHFAADTLFMSELGKGGDLVRLAEPLYRKRYHAENTHTAWADWADQVKLAAWTTHCAEMLQLALPVARSSMERRVLIGAARSRLLQLSGPPLVFGKLVTTRSPEERRKMELAFDRAALGLGAALATLFGHRDHEGDLAAAEEAAGPLR